MTELSDRPPAGPMNLDRDKIKLIHNELNLRREAHTTRWNALDNKAALLVAAAGIVAGIQGGLTSPFFGRAAAAVALVAAVIGIVSLWPKLGPEIKVGYVRDTLLGMDIAAGELKLIDTKIDIHEKNEVLLVRRAKQQRWGFTALGVSVALATVAVFVG